MSDSNLSPELQGPIIPAALPYKISTLIYIRDEAGRLLLMRRNRQPNQGLWSCIGGKLEMGVGESPFEAAIREVQEEIQLTVHEKDLHLFGIIAEKNYEFRTHWLMFLFDCRLRLKDLPPPIPEGDFAFHEPEIIMDLPIPETDRLSLWPLWFERRDGFTCMRADCRPDRPLQVTEEEHLSPPTVNPAH